MNRSVDALRCALLSVLIQKARAGSVEALGHLFESCRGYLLTVARQKLAASLRAKVDAADLVQETFMDAFRDFSSFRGETGQQLLGWLRCILLHNLADLAKHFASQCRTVSHEVPLTDHQRLPAARTRVFWTRDGAIHDQLIAQEQRRALDAALHRLPPLYRRVVQLHFGESCSFSEIGNGLKRSPEAVRKMAGRAVERLRQEMRVYADMS